MIELHEEEKARALCNEIGFHEFCLYGDMGLRYPLHDSRICIWTFNEIYYPSLSPLPSFKLAQVK